MIIVFFIACIVIGLALAPIGVIYIKSKNSKILKRLKEIKKEIIEGKLTLDQAKVLRNEATDLVLKFLKPDMNGIKEGQSLINDIRELVREIR